ncbi:MAG: HDIG domain-containing protein [Candidatus Chisholmbacteria bacterium]|nr:HDIG domain-containing protein [Candidatus Chisholmbacteria bacterium]
MITRNEALAIVKEHVKNQNLVKHMLAVEAAMAAYAKKYGEDEDRWRVAGLLHDFDWEIHPSLEKHPQDGSKILKEKGVDDDLIRTILSHAQHTGVPREKKIDQALFACDEITGLIVATTLVRPDKKLASVEVESVKKKFKQPAFAAGVKREEVEAGARDLGVDLWAEHVPTVLKAMQEIASDLGL